MMNTEQLIRDLSSLIQLDIDAVHAYGHAIEAITQTPIRSQLNKFRDDHRRHIDELSAEVRTLGGRPPAFSPDFKGYLIEGFTSLLSITGTKGALTAMETNERLTTKRYGEARSWPVPESLKKVVARNYKDEEAHLSYIEAALKGRLWATRTTEETGRRPEQKTR